MKMMSNNGHYLNFRANHVLKDVSEVEKNELLDQVKRSYLWPNRPTAWEPVAMKKVVNPALTARFMQKKMEIIGTGCPVDNCESIYGFALEREVSLPSICCDGPPKGRLARKELLGHSEKGFRVTLHPDVLFHFANVQCFKAPLHIVVYKVVLGRTKHVNLNWGDYPTLQPSLGYDCHVPTTGADKSKSIGVNVNYAQVYIYDMNDQGVQEDHPRQVLPYAVMVYDKLQQLPTERVVYRFPVCQKRPLENEDFSACTPVSTKMNKPNKETNCPTKLSAEEQIKEKTDAKNKLNTEMEASNKLHMKMLQSIKQLAEISKLMEKSPKRTKEKSPKMAKGKSPKMAKGKSPKMAKEKSPRMAKEKSPRMAKEKSPRMAKGKSPKMAKEKSPKKTNRGKTPTKLCEKRSKMKAPKVKNKKKIHQVKVDEEDDFEMVEGLVSEDVMDFELDSDCDGGVEQDDDGDHSSPVIDTTTRTDNVRETRQNLENSDVNKNTPEPDMVTSQEFDTYEGELLSSPLKNLGCFKITRPVNSTAVPFDMEVLREKVGEVISKKQVPLSERFGALACNPVTFSWQNVINHILSLSSAIHGIPTPRPIQTGDMADEKSENMANIACDDDSCEKDNDSSMEEVDTLPICPDTVPDKMKGVMADSPMPDQLCKQSVGQSTERPDETTTEPKEQEDIDKAVTSNILPMPALFTKQYSEPATEQAREQAIEQVTVQATEQATSKVEIEEGGHADVTKDLPMPTLFSEQATKPDPQEGEVNEGSLAAVSKIELDVSRDDNNNVDFSVDDSNLDENKDSRSVLIGTGSVLINVDDEDIIFISDEEEDTQEDYELNDKGDGNITESNVPSEYLTEQGNDARMVLKEQCVSETIRPQVFDVTVTDIPPFSSWSPTKESLKVSEQELEQEELDLVDNYQQCVMETEDSDTPVHPDMVSPMAIEDSETGVNTCHTGVVGVRATGSTSRAVKGLPSCMPAIDLDEMSSNHKGLGSYELVFDPMPQANIHPPTVHEMALDTPCDHKAGSYVPVSDNLYQALKSNPSQYTTSTCSPVSDLFAPGRDPLPQVKIVNITPIYKPLELNPGCSEANSQEPEKTQTEDVLPACSVAELVCLPTVTSPIKGWGTTTENYHIPIIPTEQLCFALKDPRTQQRIDCNLVPANRGENFANKNTRQEKITNNKASKAKSLMDQGRTKPETAGKFHGRTLLFGREVPPRKIPLEPLYLKHPLKKSGKAEVIPKDPRLQFETASSILLQTICYPRSLDERLAELGGTPSDHSSPVDQTPSERSVSVATCASVVRTDEDSITNSYMEDLINKAVENPNEVKKMLEAQEDRRAARAQIAELPKPPVKARIKATEKIMYCETPGSSSTGSAASGMGFYSEINSDGEPGLNKDNSSDRIVEQTAYANSHYKYEVQLSGLHDNREVSDMDIVQDNSQIQMDEPEIVIYINSDEETPLYDEGSDEESMPAQSVFKRLGEKEDHSEPTVKRVVSKVTTGGRLINPPIPTAEDSNSRSSSTGSSTYYRRNNNQSNSSTVINLKWKAQSKQPVDFSNCPWSRSSNGGKARTPSPALGSKVSARTPSPAFGLPAPTRLSDDSHSSGSTSGLINPPLGPAFNDSSSRQSVFKRIGGSLSVFSRIGDQPESMHQNQPNAGGLTSRERASHKSAYKSCLPSIFDQSDFVSFSRRAATLGRPKASVSSMFDSNDTDQLETWGVSGNSRQSGYYGHRGNI